MRFSGGKLIEQIPLEDGCAEEIEAIHVIEHFQRYNVDAVLEEFRRLLAKKGRLVLELPNLRAAAWNLLNGGDKRSSLDAIYGSDKDDGTFMSHLYGYTPESLAKLLGEHEFKHIHVMEPQTHGKRLHRDMRFEARK